MYEVVVLIERPLAESDAQQLAALYLSTPDPTRLHVLLPTGDAPGQVDSMIASIGDTGGVTGPGGPAVSVDDLRGPSADEHALIVADARAALSRTVQHLRDLGLDADGEIAEDEPLVALDSIVAERGSNEVVIMTRTHVVSQLLKIDWASVARRRLDVPVLHLLEHAEH